MSTILEVSNQILNEKNTKIIPENIKKGVTIFDIEGALEGGSGSRLSLNIFMQETEPENKNGIWLQGNHDLENVIADTNVFASEEWNTVKTNNLKEMPYSFSNGRCAAIGTDIYLFGHSSTGNRYTYKYDTLTDTYTRLTDMPIGWYAGTATAVGTDIYIMGSDNTNVKKYAYKYDTLTDTYTRLTDIPTDFYDGGADAIGTDIYLFGVYGNSTNATRYAYRYNTLNDTYTQLKAIPHKFQYGRCAAVGGYIYLFGGSGNATAAYRYNVSAKDDADADTYTKLADIPTDFKDGACIAIGTNIYLFGGSSTDLGKQVYKYDTLTDTYTVLPNIVNGFDNDDLAFNGTDIYLFGVYQHEKKPQVMTMVPKEFPNNSIVISQGDTKRYKTNLADIGILDLKTFYDRVYYRDENGVLLNNIPTYNGDGVIWTKI